MFWALSAFLLLAVAVHRKGFAGAALVHEDADDQPVRALSYLAWSVNIEITKTDGFEPEDSVEVASVDLAHEFLTCVRVEWICGHIFSEGQRRLVTVYGRR